MDLSSIKQIIRTKVPNASSDNVELYLDSVDRVLSRGGDYSDMSEDDVVEDFEYYIQSRTDIDESNIEEGWKEWAIGSLMALTTLAGIGKAYAPKIDQLDSGDEIELAQNAYADAFKKMSNEDIDSIYTQVYKSNIKGDLKQNKFSFTSKTTKSTMDAVWPDIQRASLENAVVKNIDRFVISQDGTVVFISNPGGITAIKENKPTTKMKRSELKEMIKSAFMAENSMDDDAALQGMYGGDNVYEAEEKEESLDDILARIIGTKADPYMAEDLYEAEEEEEIEIDAEEKTEKPANDSIVVDKRIVSLSSLPSNTRKILDSLETLRAQAEEFGDQKFITQVGNTITFFTRDFVVAGDQPTKEKVDESLETLRMQKLAGVITESQYETKKKVLKEKTIVNELSPELLARAGDKAKEQGRELQANKFSQAARQQIYKAQEIDRQAKLEPMKPFEGKEINLFYDIKTDKGITPATTVPHKIEDIRVDTNGVMSVNLYQNSNNSVPNAKALFFIPEADHYKISSTGFHGNDFIIRGLDQVGAQLFFKLAKAFKPDTKVTPNTLIDGAPTPIAGKSF